MTNTRTENGFKLDEELKILRESEKAYKAVANGAKTYRTAAELRAALDAEDDELLAIANARAEYWRGETVAMEAIDWG